MKEELIGKRKFIAGQSTLEVLIAMTIIVIGITSVITVFFGGQALIIDTQLEQQAVYLARQELEIARATARDNFSNLTNSSSTTADGFTKEIIVEEIDDYTKKITSKTSWQIDPTRVQKVELVTIVSNWQVAFDEVTTGGDTGGGGLSGNWRDPQTLGSVDMGPGNQATDLDVINKIVYLTAKASAANKNDFFVVDATDGTSPFIITSIDTGPGLNAIDALGNYAYVANRDEDSQLQIINITDPGNPFLVNGFKLVGVTGKKAFGESIFAVNNTVYIGTIQDEGQEFHIIDVTDPLNLVSLSSYEINGDVGAITVRNNIAYIANTTDNELIVLDVSNPVNPQQIANYNFPGQEEGQSIYWVNNKIYLGREQSGNHELHIVNVSDPASLQNLGSIDITGDLNDLVIRDNLAFLATGDSNNEFQIFDVSDPANIEFWTSFNFSQVATGIDYEDNIVYVSVRSNDALRIITSTP